MSKTYFLPGKRMGKTSGAEEGKEGDIFRFKKRRRERNAATVGATDRAKKTTRRSAGGGSGGEGKKYVL